MLNWKWANLIGHFLYSSRTKNHLKWESDQNSDDQNPNNRLETNINAERDKRFAKDD